MLRRRMPKEGDRMTAFDGKNLTLRGRLIESDENGLIRLNDIHTAAGFSKNQTPGDWTALTSTSQKTIQVLKLNTGKSGNWTKKEYRSTIYAKRGAGGGTYADPRLALDYAEYLNPKLAIEVNEVFLRYKAGDATLADEVLQRAPAEDNEWAARRAMGRAVRGHYTKELHERGVANPKEYAICTNQTYQGLFDATAKKLKEQKGLPKSANLRDSMDMKEIAFVAASEALAVERMTEEESEGFGECRTATSMAAGSIRSAIDHDRKNRQKKLR
jgi:hypothetical protein